MKKTGIVVVFYNIEDYVAECLNSIKNQTFSDFKCICIDDQSTDDTFKELQKFCDSDDRFSVIQNEKNYGSPCHSRNVGIDYVSDCEYFMLMDGDDLIHPQTLEISINGFNQHLDISFVAFDKLNFSDTKDIQAPPQYDLTTITVEKYTKPLELFLNRDKKSPQPSAWNKLYRTADLKEFKFYEDIFYEEDYLYALQILSKTEQFALVSLPLYFYRRHGASITSYLKHERYLNDATTRLKHTYAYFIQQNNVPNYADGLFQAQMARDAYRMIVSKIIRNTKDKTLQKKIIPITQRNFQSLLDEKIIDTKHLTVMNRFVIHQFLNNNLKTAWFFAKIFG